MVAAFILTNQNNIAFQFLKHYFNFSNNSMKLVIYYLHVIKKEIVSKKVTVRNKN